MRYLRLSHGSYHSDVYHQSGTISWSRPGDIATDTITGNFGQGWHSFTGTATSSIFGMTYTLASDPRRLYEAFVGYNNIQTRLQLTKELIEDPEGASIEAYQDRFIRY